MFYRSAWAQPTIVVSGTKCEGAAMTSARSVGVGLASHCGGGHDRSGRCSVLCSLGRRGLRQPLWWQKRQVRAQHFPLLVLSAWDQPATLVAGTTDQVTALASDGFVGMGLDIRSGGGHNW